MRVFGGRRWRRASVAGLVTVATAALLPAATGSAAAAGDGHVPARYAKQRLSWHACDGKPSLECATMTVPRDWHHPADGPDLAVSVSRHRAADPAARRGVLMMAAGGPGGQGLLRPARFAEKSPAVAAAYDIVSFNQRGLPLSSPLTCQTKAEFDAFFGDDARDRSPAAVRGVVRRSRQLARACQERSGGLAPYITTDQTVRDMDLFRALLGARRIAYYGPSYATMIGAYYATEFPHRVDRLVLDSPVGFAGTWQSFEEGQPLSFQRRFEQDFLPWLAAHDATYHYGRTAAGAKERWEARRRALREHPVDLGDGRRLTPNVLDNATVQALYNAEGFAPLASALSVLERWDTATPAERAAVGRAFPVYLSPEFLAEFAAVTCNDTPWSRDMDGWVRRTAAYTAKYPLAGARALAFAAACAAWPASHAPRVHVTGKGLPTTLMLASRHDPATHYEGALGAHRALRGSRLVTVGGGDHGQYQNGNPCVDSLVDRYLLAGAAPARDTTCPAPGTSG
ncbi:MULTISPECIES: alpha/beta hydrolase [Streptomyces]|uniref:Alpha/beta hydrolase n=2 Tax=Streptomyces rimosus subsp. rimosus TaxID=132474 RepID=A0A8A1URE0_STRR1|nr:MULTISPECIES: alpha/beta hydrolase [Streptomyces]KOG67935.1 peptidase [Kitasatospora aureofaciens]MYT44744.1 alpha/beta fold hydrolase [Streptomyces sp. SID5471]KOT45723.1 peptidase [Streptomyces rimosus subsp. rimosus]KOT47014.1 peptidase [Streptomyces sp. NRRL WC-3701]KOT47225.1 peptidase [Streptomyces rimosus subsp. rimosus]